MAPTAKSRLGALALWVAAAAGAAELAPGDSEAYFGAGPGEAAPMAQIGAAPVPARRLEENSSTTATTTHTTTTMTGTATETWTRAVGCTMSTLNCPIPRHLAHAATYMILGNESATTGQTCGPPSATSVPMLFEVDAHACNVTETYPAPGGLELSVTLVPVVETGQIMFNVFEPPVILCKCAFLNNTATAGLSVTVEFEDGPTRDVGGGSAFTPTLRLFADALFAQPISPGQVFPVASDRFYVEVTSNQTEDVIGVPTCTVAPTNDTDHAFAHLLLDGYCSAQAFEVDYSSDPGDGGPPHTLRWSMRKFKFASYPMVHIMCEVVRCGSPPCGTCDSAQQGARRLHRNLQQDPDGVATSYFSLPPGANYLVFPGDVPEEAKRVKFVSPSTPQTALNTTWINVTIYSFPGIEDGDLFAAHFEELVHGYVGSEVHVQQVWQVGDAALPDATIVSIYQVEDGATDDVGSRMQQLPQSLFLSSLLGLLGEHDHTAEFMRVEVSSAREVPGSHDVLAPAPAPDPSAASAELPVIIVLVVVAVVVIVCILCMIVSRRQRKKRAQQQADDEAAKAEEGSPGEVGQAAGPDRQAGELAEAAEAGLAQGKPSEKSAGELAEAAEGGFIGADQAAVAANAGRGQEEGEYVI